MAGDGDDLLQWFVIVGGLGALGYFFAMALLWIIAGAVIGAIAAVLILAGGLKAWIGLTRNNPKLALATVILTVVGSLLALQWVHTESLQGPKQYAYGPAIEVPLILLGVLGPWVFGIICWVVSMDEFEKPQHALSVMLFTISIVIVAGAFVIASHSHPSQGTIGPMTPHASVQPAHGAIPGLKVAIAAPSHSG